MGRTTRWAAIAAAALAVVGCTLTQSDVRKDGVLARVGAAGARIGPRRCALKVMIVARPRPDPALDDALWRVADEQAVSPAARRAWDANGLRVGKVAGPLPPEVQALLDAPPPHKVEPQALVLPSGEGTLIEPGAAAATPQISLLRSRDGKVAGKAYTDAKGYLRLVASHDEGPGLAVTVRVVPELHHGPFRPGWAPAPSLGAFAPQQLALKTGQEEETFRDLAASLELRPGELAVFGGRPDRPGSLGDLLFSEPEPHSDRRLQKVVFLWAARAEPDAPARPAGLVPVDPPGRNSAE